MQKWPLLGLLCTLSGIVAAQVITVSDELNLKTEFLYDILGRIGDNLLVVRDGVNEFDVIAYNDKMSTTWTAEEELDSRRSRIISIVPHDDKFHVIYSDEWRDTMAIKVREYNAKVNVTFTDTLVLIKKGLIRPKFRYVKSEDRNIFLMTEIDNEKIVSAFAYDLSRHVLLWEANFEFAEANFREDYRKTLISNDGTMYVVFEKDNFRYKKDDHTMEIFRFDQFNTAFTQTSIPLSEFITYDAFFKYDNLNEQLLIIGLYSDKNTGNTDGLYHISLNANNLSDFRIATLSYDEELVSDFHGKYNPKKESLYNLDVQDLILREDGGVLVLAEENKEYERLAYGGRRDYYGSNRFSVDYYYEDLVLISIHQDGTSHWQKLLPKRQYSNDDEAAYSSYFLFKNPSYLRILYNDEIRNDNTVSEYIMNGAGDITRRSLMSTDNQKLKLQIKNAVQIGSNELIVPSVRGKRLKLVRLQY
ncbi:MAG: hypothetical protein IPL46_08245 [Saprospiraceae bacterium]|nr:hypothetical protein [Saprospiraceae bacterium]